MTPEGWSLRQLRECADRITSGGTPRVNRADYYGGTIPFVKIDDITSKRGLYIHDTKTTITELAIRETSARVFPAGTVFVTMYGTIGAVGIAARELAANQAIAAFVGLRDTDPVFLAYLLAYEAPSLARKAGQTTQANISGTILKAHETAFPPLPEQRKIAAILSAVDHGIEATQNVLDQLQVLKKSALAELLKRGLPGRHDRFKETEVGTIPEGWDLVSFESLLAEGDSLSYGILQPGNDVGEGIPMLRTVDLDDHGGRADTAILRVSREIEAPYERTRLRGGEVLLSVMGTVGRTLVVPTTWQGWNVNRALAVIRLNDRVDPKFLSFWLRSPATQARFDVEKIGSAQKRINLGDLRKMTVPLPSLAEQSLLCEAFSTLETRWRSEVDALAAMQSAKRALASALLSGDVRVGSGDPA